MPSLRVVFLNKGLHLWTPLVDNLRNPVSTIRQEFLWRCLPEIISEDSFRNSCRRCPKGFFLRIHPQMLCVDSSIPIMIWIHFGHSGNSIKSSYSDSYKSFVLRFLQKYLLGIWSGFDLISWRNRGRRNLCRISKRFTKKKLLEYSHQELLENSKTDLLKDSLKKVHNDSQKALLADTQ